MSGRRCRALKRAFIAKHGRAPYRARIASEGKAGEIETMKPVRKSGWLNGIRQASKVVERFLRPVYTVTFAQPSEWRQLKNAYKWARSHGTEVA